MLYKESQKEVVNKGDLEGYSYNKREQPKGKGQEDPPQKELKNDGLPIVVYHWKDIIKKSHFYHGACVWEKKRDGFNDFFQ